MKVAPKREPIKAGLMKPDPSSQRQPRWDGDGGRPSKVRGGNGSWGSETGW
jgi:hypothetical protein